MSPPNFTGRDPRGRRVALKAGVWVRHVVPHKPYMTPHHADVIATLEEPEIIIDNDPGPNAPNRKSGERYVRFCASLGQHIVVPVKIVTVANSMGGIALGPDDRDALTAYASAGVPTHNTVIWTPPPANIAAVPTVTTGSTAGSVAISSMTSESNDSKSEEP